jgi:hypothetical protein
LGGKNVRQEIAKVAFQLQVRSNKTNIQHNNYLERYSLIC